MGKTVEFDHFLFPSEMEIRCVEEFEHGKSQNLSARKWHELISMQISPFPSRLQTAGPCHHVF
jgi:hypothetical protein